MQGGPGGLCARRRGPPGREDAPPCSEAAYAASLTFAVSLHVHHPGGLFPTSLPIAGDFSHLPQLSCPQPRGRTSRLWSARRPCVRQGHSPGRRRPLGDGFLGLAVRGQSICSWDRFTGSKAEGCRRAWRTPTWPHVAGLSPYAPQGGPSEGAGRPGRHVSYIYYIGYDILHTVSHMRRT